jgi:hypothetical protein
MWVSVAVPFTNAPPVAWHWVIVVFAAAPLTSAPPVAWQ